MKINMDVGAAFGMGSKKRLIFWISKAAVLAAGGKDNGGPGPRPDYGPDYYYAKFVHDPEGKKKRA
jgi:hypothetical protein